MIKVYKLKTIVMVLLVIFLIAGFILVSKNKSNYKSIQTSNNNSNAYKILVDVEDSKLFLFENNELIKIYKCSGGKWSTPSPIGTWTIISKAKWGEGCGGSWMGLNVPWGQFRNSWNFRYIFSRLGKFSWLYKNE